ncbi:MAG: GreA/GreB family elongation factor [Ginsengibacter sp.]
MAATNTITVKNDVLLLRRDHAILDEYVKNLHGMKVNERENFARLSEELAKATIIPEENFPEDRVRINSTVLIKDLDTNRDMSLTIVLPDSADIKQRKVSVLAPLGTALLGFKKGTEASWEAPAGKKSFKIMEVDNSIPHI